MTPDEYVKLAIRTESNNFEEIIARMSVEMAIRLDHAFDGLVTEAGEAKDAIKKYKFYGKEIDLVNCVEELGDLMWYIAIACDAIGISLEEVMEKNIAKLKARYGDKFNEEDALNRDLETERKTLESVTRATISTKSEFSKVHLSVGGITTTCGKPIKEVRHFTADLYGADCEICLKKFKVNFSKDICGNE